MNTPSIGHNSGVSLYVSDVGKLQAIDAVLKNPTFSQTEALILIGLIVRSDKAYENAFPGASTLAVYAKVAKTETIFKALRRLEDHYEMVKRASRGNGRSNSYTVMPQRVVDAIVKEFDARKKAAAETHPAQGGAPIGEPTPSNGAGLPETHPAQGGGPVNVPAPVNGVGPPPNPPRSKGLLPAGHPVQGGATHPVQRGTYPFHDPSHKDSQGGDTARPREGANRFVPINWQTALNGQTAEDAHDVFWNPDGTLCVQNGFKVELESTFPSVNLVSGLAIVAGEARRDEVGTDLKRRIRRKFGYLQNDELGRDRRSTTARKAASKPFKPSRW
jgi:hypothetical protein